MRDNFSQQTILELAKGVCYRCSNPECNKPTVGANAAQDGIISLGIAAHVCAASPGGPRYNPAQTPAVRRSKDNGIWLCQSCGKLVDSDPRQFTVEVLARWKSNAQRRAFRELVAPDVAGQPSEATRVRPIIASDNAMVANADYEEVFSKAHAAAIADLAAFKRGPTWTLAPIELTLRLDSDQDEVTFGISTLPLAVEAAPEVAIVASPGTGKTVTMLQLADHTLAANSLIPIYWGCPGFC